VLSLASGILWRAELEIRGGWPGLTWTTYFHYSIPAIIALFLVWGNAFVILHRSARVWFHVVATIGAGMLLLLVFQSLMYRYASGLAGMLLYHNSSDVEIAVYRNLLYFLVPATPIALRTLLWVFDQDVSWRYLAASVVAAYLSFPASRWLLHVIPHPGGADYLHALKSGFIFPFLIFSMGILMAGVNKRIFDPAPSDPTS
jgi:hypothetical protein